MHLISGAQAFGSARFGQGTGRIVFDDVRCVGFEPLLAFCPLSRTHNCTHLDDAGVRCQGKSGIVAIAIAVARPVADLGNTHCI